MPEWRDFYLQLVTYYKKHQHCNVPKYSKPHPGLGDWVRIQRLLKRHDVLPREHEQFLNRLGFNYNIDPRDSKRLDIFVRRCIELSTFYQTKGHSRVPLRIKSPSGLGKWVQKQRQIGGDLSHPKINLINQITENTFPWEVLDSKSTWHKTWMVRYDELIAYHNEFGSYNVPRAWSRNKQLGVWVNRQRTLCNMNKINAKRRELLAAIKFIDDSLIDNKEVA